MPLTKEQKEEVLAALIENMKSAKSVVFSNFQGLSVEEISTLRNKMRESGIKYQVAKKTLIRRAAAEVGHTDIPDEALEGPVAVAFSMEDEIAAAKLIHKSGKEFKNLKLLGAIFEGKVLSVAKTKELAMLPGKEELAAKLVYLLKSPIQGFHGALNNTVSGFVRVLNAIKEKQEEAA